jgi:rod shape-determining protein MreC
MLYGLLAVVLMAMDQRGHFVPRIRSLALYLVEPVYHVVEWPVRAARNVFGQFQSHRSMRDDNEILKQQLLRQKGVLQRFEAMSEENRRLRSLIEGAQGQTFEFQYAELVRVDLDPFSHKVVVNRGAVDEVTTGQAVIDGAGVMGQVEDVRPHFSTIRLISDPNHALPVQINRTGLRTVAFGSGETGVLKMPSVPRQADVRQGDLIVTSGLGNRFPGGYPVAIVSGIYREEGQTFVLVEAMPLAALDRGREVLLISTQDAAQEEGQEEAQDPDLPGGLKDESAPGEDAGQEMDEPEVEQVGLEQDGVDRAEEANMVDGEELE